MSAFRRFSAYGLAYLLWLVSFILGGMVLFQIREAYLSLVVVTTFKKVQGDATAEFYAGLQTRALDQWSYLLLGLLLIVLIVFIEHHYRTAVEPGLLRIRFFRVTALEFSLLFVANLTAAATVWSVSAFTFRSLFYPILELITAGIFIWLWLDIRRRSNQT
jgi:hypothetical protein